MKSCSNELSTEAAAANLFKRGDSHMEQERDEEHDEEAEEEEDVDFNPFLKETASLEASSSLSSEAEDEAFSANLSSRPPSGFQDYAVGDFEYGEEIVMQSVVSSVGACANESERISSPRPKKRKSVLISQPENGTFREKDNGSSSRTEDAANDDPLFRNSIMDLDDEDAICMRTRARYSLASFTLDELETFLQESDDDDLHNVDDEEEYRKFLAAVLQGGDGDGHATHESENVDDEDEDNDADFELEIEEALESDLDENTRGEQEEEGRRPKTRQNRRQKASLRYKKKLLDPSNRPLRPLLPNTPIVPFPALDGNRLMPGTDSHHFLSSVHNSSVNGFTPHQLGQLHCLIHEHMQLLIQVFSLCVHEHSRQHIASQVQELISEVLHKRDQVLSWRRVPYPFFCFVPPYIHPSVPNELSKSLTAQTDSSSGKNEKLTSDVISPSEARYESLPSGQKVSCQNPKGSFWMPFANGPILSVLDVAPLNLVGNYIDDISTALRENQRRYVEATADTHFEREPLFPLDNLSSSEANSEVLRGTTTRDTQTVPYSPASDQPPKKTLAAALVERTKKQSVATVPKEIAKLAQRFFPLFNPALFPHKPPPAPVANRVLFTDAEDELLALGLMEYNTDWKAIQQRFLPCKSKHQIFVRQKNRSSSKAPENPIKGVRRMKNSPLTAEEIARIQEGLKVFKLDWMSVWRFVVPHRDPSLLPRQWRIAAGTQKSYKSNAEKKEKRRLYESNRRKCRPVALASWQTSSEKEDCRTDNAGGGNNSGDDCVDNENEAYVHEAFLADWSPSTSSLVSSKIPVSILREKHLPSNFFPSRFTESQPQVGQEFPNALKHSQNLHTSSSFGPNHQVSDVNSKSSKSQFCFRPVQAYRGNNARLVKLAPDLPPVNLPPSVRIMSQSAFTSYHGGAATENVVSRLPHGAKLGTSHQLQARENTSSPLKRDLTNSPPQKSGVRGNKCVAGEKGESDLQMHPLLFRAPEDGLLPYYPLNCSNSTCSSFNFFGGNQAQFNLSLFHSPHQASNVNYFHKSSKSKETTSSACGIDFHPLLQRSDDVNSHSAITKCAQVQKPSDAVLTESRVNGSLMATCTKPSSPSGKANELDLEIHLSTTSREENASGSRDGISNVGDRSLVMSGNNIARNVGDLSLPEIVMEQEELSDSEEEDGEHVEFECEEMADSEGEEGSDYEQIVDIQDKEAPHVTSKKLGTDTDFDDQQCEASEHSSFQSNICATSEGTLKSGPIDQAKDSRSSSLSLSLNSCVPDHPLNSKTKTKHAVSINEEGFVGKLSPPSRSDRSVKKTKPSTKNVTSQAGDIQQQLKLGSRAFNPSRKLRKHPTRTRSSLTIGRAEKRD